MSIRHIFSCAIVTGLALASVPLAYAEKSHDGKVVSVTEGSGSTSGKLVMTDNAGKNEHSHSISSSAKITRNDNTAKLGDLKKGDSVTVTTGDNGDVTALKASESSSAGSSSSNEKNEKSDKPDFLANLKLSSDQKSKIDDIEKKYDADFDSTWKEFSDHYQLALRLEASMLAAIEEHFTDAQRKELRQQRQRVAHHHKHHDGKSKVKVTTEAPRNEVVEETLIIGIQLTPQQQEKTHSVRRNFADRLSSLNDEIDRLQAKLVSLETEKLLDIEEVLTKEQREQLRKDHQSLTSKNDGTSEKTSVK